MSDERSTLKNMLAFLERAQLSGAEVDAFRECKIYVLRRLNALDNEAKERAEKEFTD